MDGWTDRQIDGWRDGQTDRQTDRRTIFKEEATDISHSLFSCKSSLLIVLEFGDVGFVEGRKLEILKKNPWCKARTNDKLNPHMAASQQAQNVYIQDWFMTEILKFLTEILAYLDNQKIKTWERMVTLKSSA